jgi:hypothetical protein
MEKKIKKGLLIRPSDNCLIETCSAVCLACSVMMAAKRFVSQPSERDPLTTHAQGFEIVLAA